MKLLNVIDVLLSSGGAFWGVTAFWLALCIWLFIEALKEHKQPYGWYNPQPPAGWNQISNKTPWKKIHEFWGIWIVTAIYIGILVWIYSDYK